MNLKSDLNSLNLNFYKNYFDLDYFYYYFKNFRDKSNSKIYCDLYFNFLVKCIF